MSPVNVPDTYTPLKGDVVTFIYKNPDDGILSKTVRNLEDWGVSIGTHKSYSGDDVRVESLAPVTLCPSIMDQIELIAGCHPKHRETLKISIRQVCEDAYRQGRQV